MKKLLTILTSFLLFTFAAIADDGPYVGFKPSKLKIKWSTAEGIDLNEIYDDEYRVMDFHAGYNFGKYFVELGYLDSSKEGLSGSASIKISEKR